jgi:hypothetical protein
MWILACVNEQMPKERQKLFAAPGVGEAPHG